MPPRYKMHDVLEGKEDEHVINVLEETIRLIKAGTPNLAVVIGYEYRDGEKRLDGGFSVKGDVSMLADGGMEGVDQIMHLLSTINRPVVELMVALGLGSGPPRGSTPPGFKPRES